MKSTTFLLTVLCFVYLIMLCYAPIFICNPLVCCPYVAVFSLLYCRCYCAVPLNSLLVVFFLIKGRKLLTGLTTCIFVFPLTLSLFNLNCITLIFVLIGTGSCESESGPLNTSQTRPLHVVVTGF